MKLPLALTLLLAACAAHADYVLTGLTYHGYCPPNAIRARLCTTGQDFVADDYIKAPGVLGEYVVNQLVQVPPDISLGSRIVVPYTAYVSGLPVVRRTEYVLADLWRDVTLCELLAGEPIETVTKTGRAVTVEPSGDACKLSVRAEFTEPQSVSRTVTHDATMTFYNSACAP